MNKTDKYSTTPFLVACRTEQSMDVLEMLLERGADMNKPDSHGFTPLSFSCLHLNSRDLDRSSDLGLSTFLLERGAFVNPSDRIYGQTPLHIAVARGHKERVNLLVAHGARFDLTDHHGRTPYHMAVESLEMCFFLLRHHNMISVLRSTSRCGCATGIAEARDSF